MSNLRRLYKTIKAAIFFFVVCTFAAASELSLDSALKARLSQSRPINGKIRLAREMQVRKFYAKTDFKPIWYAAGVSTQVAMQLLDRLRQSRQDGLRPREYHVGILESVLNKPLLSIDEKVDTELLLTDAFINYVGHLLNGRIRPSLADPEWHIFHKEVLDEEWFLAQISNERSINSILDEVGPQEPSYHRLKQALKAYLAIRDLGGWEWRTGQSLKLGDQGAVVHQLYKRLVFTGDLVEESDPMVRANNAKIFDDRMSEGLRKFQLRHGISPTGALDTSTSKALSVSVSERIIQLELNMERWRWLPRKLERPSIVVNAPEFGLEVIEEAGRTLMMKVVIGKQLRRTPVLAGRIETVVLNPKWIVPDRIAIDDLLPAIRKDFRMLKRKGIHVYQWKGTHLVEIAPRKIHWQNVTPDNFDFMLVQDPGPENVQGKFKFVFPNNFGVYIHDTPMKTLFNHSARTYSSGCIRVENAAALAEYLLKKIEGQNWELIREKAQNDITLEVPLVSKLPVYLLYWTAWVGDDNLVQFRSDIYGRDALLRSVLAY
ncbi:MAG: L,D-transpeptidase family protein [Bdellovibrio sp.]|nr:L,D-transpeptidase family protein [Bdellovibrio sp.]